MLNELKDPNKAHQRAAEDANRGLVDAPTKRAAENAFKLGDLPPVAGNNDGALSDAQLAANMLTQAKRMELEAQGLIAEAARMKKDAERLHPSVSANHTPLAQTAEPVKRGRGRPSKASATNHATQ